MDARLLAVVVFIAAGACQRDGMEVCQGHRLAELRHLMAIDTVASSSSMLGQSEAARSTTEFLRVSIMTLSL